jgi:hypothetical protein
VNTTDSESITAASALAFPPYAAEQFRYWQQLNSATTTPIGVVYQATKNSTAYIVALYGPDPCQNDRKNFESCEEEGLGKACYPLGHILQLCEYANRESNTP